MGNSIIIQTRESPDSDRDFESAWNVDLDDKTSIAELQELYVTLKYVCNNVEEILMDAIHDNCDLEKNEKD